MPDLAVVNLPNWGLWSNSTWRAVAIRSPLLVTAAFIAYCATYIDQDSTSVVLTQGSQALAKGAVSLVTGYTLFSYPAMQKENQIKKRNLSSLMNIGMLSDALLKKYNLEPQQHPQLDKFITEIKTTARACINIRMQQIEPTQLLEEINQLMDKLELRLIEFTASLPDSLDQLNHQLLRQEQLFWQQDPLKIKEELLGESIQNCLPTSM